MLEHCIISDIIHSFFCFKNIKDCPQLFISSNKFYRIFEPLRILFPYNKSIFALLLILYRTCWSCYNRKSRNNIKRNLCIKFTVFYCCCYGCKSIPCFFACNLITVILFGSFHFRFLSNIFFKASNMAVGCSGFDFLLFSRIVICMIIIMHLMTLKRIVSRLLTSSITFTVPR